jgi:hypothetical protein
MTDIIDIKQIKTRKLNDSLRQTLSNTALGRIFVTQGVSRLDSTTQSRLFTSIMKFDGFNEDNDPYGEHDFGAVTVLDERGTEHRALFKIDYYDKSLEFGSEDPSNENMTTRVLTIMTPSEY